MSLSRWWMAGVLACACHASPARRVVVSDTSIDVLGTVHFVGATATIEPDSARRLDNLATMLVGNPSISLIDITAYGMDAPPAERQPLADQRAEALVAYLVAHGVEPNRLTAHGDLAPPADRTGEPVFVIVKRRS